jgi:CoA-transferase family III
MDIPAGILDRATTVAERVGADAVEALTGRAALLGISARGRTSAGGATRLIAAADGWLVLTLSRPDDVDAVPALLETDSVGADPWPAVWDWAARRGAATAVERARLLGLPAALPGEVPAAAPRRTGCGVSSAPRTPEGLLVADLTSMWAGPLCGQLLADAGATVIKVESPTRPDGTRSGHPDFFDWVNNGKLCYSVDFDRETDRLAALLRSADVVLEGSRATALQRRGLGPHQISGPPGRVWLRVSGYGSAEGRAERVAFGDDAAVAGGLLQWIDDAPAFIGDAIADPLTGLEATAIVLRSLRFGGGELIEIALTEVAAEYAGDLGPERSIDPVRPTVGPHAAAPGADNAEVERLVERRGAGC